jgi:phospholipid/cholesterol/gamma-HCH transport system substrate-binding protein
VGTVKDVSIEDNRLAKVAFTIRKGVRVNAGSVIQIKFRNLVGQRYLSVEPPTPTGTGDSDIQPASATTGADSTIKPGHTFGVDETRPALDLTVLFNGFRPLLQMLNPDDVNALSAQIIAVFQGEDATVDGLLKSTASLTSTLADKDQVIGELITSLSGVMTTVNDRSGQLDTTLVAMQQLVSGLSEDRASIGDSIEGMGELTTRVADLMTDIRPPLRKSIAHVGVLSNNLDKHSTEVDSFLQKLPVKLDKIGRLGSYGSWLNFYLCSMDGRIPMPEGFMGDLGVKPVAGRCR